MLNITGTVLKIEKLSIKCELYLDKKIIEVSIPKSLFPKDICYGSPILLIFNINKNKQLVIKNRLIQKEDMNIGNKEMTSLISKL